MTKRLRITAIENPILAELKDSVKIWLSVIDGVAKPRSFSVSGHKLINHAPIIQALKAFLGVTSTEGLVGQEFQAEIANCGDELTITHFIKGLTMTKAELTVERQRMRVQVVGIEEKVSKAGNEMFAVKCVAVPLGAPDDMEPTDPFTVFYLKSRDFAMKDIQRMQEATGARHWKNLPGREFQALVFIQSSEKGDFPRLWYIQALEEQHAAVAEQECPF
ncbi:MAG: hypothetical protein Q4A17_06535 [Thermoguttaceae bacterium]|nr:hypothetical protein [Thermoguttaceae bacterium]